MRTHRLAPLAASLLALSACGDGGGAILTPGDDDDDPTPSDCTPTTCGEVRIALTDADGDFLSYAVDLVSIRLERSNGDDVQVPLTRQRVDFAELADVSEFVLAEDIPNGAYERAIVRLDFSDAAVSVEVDGLPAEAEVVDANGDAVGIVEVEIVLDELNPLVVATATPALLQLDFDLEASHEVNLGTTPSTVTAAPFLVASLEAAGHARVPRARPARLRERVDRPLRREPAPLRSPHGRARRVRGADCRRHGLRAGRRGVDRRGLPRRARGPARGHADRGARHLQRRRAALHGRRACSRVRACPAQSSTRSPASWPPGTSTC